MNIWIIISIETEYINLIKLKYENIFSIFFPLKMPEIINLDILSHDDTFNFLAINIINIL